LQGIFDTVTKQAKQFCEL